MSDMQFINLSGYNNVFCDSKESLEFAYKHGLPKNALVRTSSPAMLWDKKPNIQHIESRWSIKRTRYCTIGKYYFICLKYN